MTSIGLASIVVVLASVGGGQARPPSPQLEAARRVTEADSNAIRASSQRLKDVLAELNQLAAIPATDRRHDGAQKRIAELSDEVIKQTIAIYTVLDKSGVGNAASTLAPTSLPGLANGLAPRERELLAEAGFSTREITEISIVLTLRSRELMPKISAAQQRAELEQPQTRRMPVGKILRLGAGGLMIGYDIGSLFIPMVNVVSAGTMITSVTGGMVVIGEAMAPDSKPK